MRYSRRLLMEHPTRSAIFLQLVSLVLARRYWHIPLLVVVYSSEISNGS